MRLVRAILRIILTVFGVFLLAAILFLGYGLIRNMVPAVAQPATTPVPAPNAVAMPAPAPAVADSSTVDTREPAVSAGKLFDCDAAVVSNLDNPKVDPIVKIPAGNGVVISMDPGSVSVDSIKIAESTAGMLIGYYNDATIEVTATVKTGWNSPNGRWNTYICRFALDKAQVWARANEKQDKEKKPVFKLIVRSDTIANKIVDQPTTSPSGSTATSCDSTGAWKGKLTVPAGCILWVSSDAGGGTIDDTKYSYTEGYTMKVTGPAVVDITTPAADKINHWMAKTGVMTADKDNKNVNVVWDAKTKKFVSR